MTIRERPELIPAVSLWLWETFWRGDGFLYEETEREVAASVALVGPPQCFVLLANGEPAGTATLVAEDLETRRDLTPWLAGVFVAPWARRRGYAAELVAAVERAAREAGTATLWLYTSTAERIYRRLDWWVVEYFERHGRMAALMRRDFE